MDSSTIIAPIALTLLFWLEGVMPFYTRRRGRVAHGFRNLTLAAAAGAVAALMAPLILASIDLAAERGVGLGNSVDLHPIALAAVGFLLFDLWMYTWHRMNHRIPFLWRFHRVHHTDPAMDSTTALRFHPGEILLSMSLNCLVLVALGMSLAAFVLYKSVMIVVILFHHGNLRIPARLDGWLRLVIVPPSLHRVHHSHHRPETDSNYGTIFSFWDRLFGTYRTRRAYDDIRFGIGAYDSPLWQRPMRLLTLPLQPLSSRDGT